MMTGKRWILVCSFAIALVLGLSLIIPPDVWQGGADDATLEETYTLSPLDAGEGNITDSDQNVSGAVIGDYNLTDYDGDINYILYSNETVSNEPVYWLYNGTYDYAIVAPALENDTVYLDESLFVLSGSDDYDEVYNKTNADSDLAIPRHADDADAQADESGGAPLSFAEDGSSSIGWIFQSVAYVAVCAIIFALLFARLSNEDIMVGVRKDIYDFISQNPGEHLANITKEFNMSSSSTRHHLYVLETSDKIVSHKPGKHKHYYINQNGYSRLTSGAAEYKDVMSALRNDTSRNIVKLLSRNTGMNQQMISQALNIHPSTVNWHAKRLRAANIIRKTRQGKDIIYSLNEDMELNRVISIIEGTSS